jgi:serine/arginine repetitive matrix protein 2
MRGSVREPAPATAPAQETPRGSSRFSLRSLSPTGFRRNSNTSSPPPVVMGGRMRQSLRSESSEAEPSRKRLSGFGRPAKAKKSNGGSRFEDSSDEDESRPSFRSRFVDSSDEDILSPIPKQKRVPKTMRGSSSNGAAAAAAKTPASRAGMQDSPDLPDSDDDEEQPQQGITSNGAASRSTPVLNRNGSGRGNFGVQNDNVEKMGARPGHKRRGSFMSSILRRKKDPSDKISRNTSESASRRDTHLERAPERLAVIRSNSEGAAHNSRLLLAVSAHLHLLRQTKQASSNVAVLLTAKCALVLCQLMVQKSARQRKRSLEHYAECSSLTNKLCLFSSFITPCSS